MSVGTAKKFIKRLNMVSNPTERPMKRSKSPAVNGLCGANVTILPPYEARFIKYPHPVAHSDE